MTTLVLRDPHGEPYLPPIPHQEILKLSDSILAINVFKVYNMPGFMLG